MAASKVRAIAFYLPQFHPIPENDEWWGKGFTEWANVTKAKPLFPGHYQPHLPTDLGFYDLRLPEVREQQAELAKQYGIHGFCYYHYWFNGRRILERPFNEVLESGKPDFPFCLCWANENWTRVWDGGEKHILLEQNYNEQDDLAHIQSLFPVFRDDRYIRIDGKPLFLVYKAELLPNPIRTAEIWREAAIKAGIGDIYLARVECQKSVSHNIYAPSLGFDADVEFAPFSWPMGNVKYQDSVSRVLATLGLLSKGFINNRVTEYDDLVRGMLSRPEVSWTRFHCVTPSWDNSARRKNAAIFVNSTPEKYGYWLKQVVAKTNQNLRGDEKIIFINAWNEWAEGNHLEPDLKWGKSYLEATLRSLNATPVNPDLITNKQNINTANSNLVQLLYWKLNTHFKQLIDLFKSIG